MINNLYILKLDYLLQYLPVYLILLSITAVGSAILVIISKNPITSILFLICLFMMIAIYLVISGMKFIGLSYLLVYIGAVSILFLFILMLINIRISEIQTDSNTSLPLAIVISASFYISTFFSIPFNFTETMIQLNSIIDKSNNLDNSSLSIKNYVFSTQWDSNLFELLHISNIGNILYTNSFMWLILTSIILLLAMIGTIIITIKQQQTDVN